MLLTLIKKELLGFGHSVMNSGKLGSKKRTVKSTTGTVLIGFAMLYFVGIMCFLFYTLASTLCEPFVSIGLDWAYFAIMGILSLTLSIIGGALTSYSTVYRAKDNEFLLSLPIRPSLILSTRIMICYAMDFVINALVVVITIFVYASSYPLTAGMIIGGIVNIIFFPLIGLVLSLILGWLIAVATAKVPPEKKSYVSLAFVLLFLVVYIVLYSKMMDIMDLILNAGNSVAGFLETWVKPVFWMGKGAMGDAASILLLTLLSLALFAIVYMILSTSFIKVVTTQKGNKRVKYREEQLKTTNQSGALLGRELLRFRRNATIMVNYGVSLLFLVILGIGAVVFKGKINELTSQFTDMNDVLMMVGTAGVLYIILMAPITASAISLEADTLWILKSLPITTWNVLSAKLKEHVYLVGAAGIIAMAGLIIVFEPSVLMAIVAIFTVAAFICFLATWGLRLNIRKPSFNWNNEAAAVKRSASVTVAMLGSMGIVITLAVLYVVLQYNFEKAVSPVLFLCAVGILFAVMSEVNYRWLRTKGIALFDEI